MTPRTQIIAAVLAVVAAIACSSTPSEPAATQAQTQAQSQPSPAATPTPTSPSTEAAPSTPTPQPTPTPQTDAPAKPKLSRDAMCEGICARASELKCSRANDCPKMCADTMKVDVCGAELSAATECVLAQPTDNWQCTAQGVASIKDPFCVDEQKAFGNCLIASSPKP